MTVNLLSNVLAGRKFGPIHETIGFGVPLDLHNIVTSVPIICNIVLDHMVMRAGEPNLLILSQLISKLIKLPNRLLCKEHSSLLGKFCDTTTWTLILE